MPKWLQYTLAGIAIVAVALILRNTWSEINSAGNQYDDEIDAIQESLDKIQE